MTRQNHFLGAAIICSSTAVFCAVLAVNSNRPESSTNTINVSPLGGVFDFGSVGQGSYSGSFVLENPTREPVRIEGVNSSCRCTVPRLKQQVIPSGGTIDLDFEWNAVGYGGHTQSRILLSFRGEVSLTSWTQELLIESDVMPDFGYSPAMLSFAERESSGGNIQFSPIGDPGFRIRAAYCTHRAFDVEVDEARRMVTVRFNSERWRASSRNANVIVKTNCQTSTATIPIHVESSNASSAADAN